MRKRAKSLLIVSFILISGFIFRVYNLNWDQNHHLHPDERFLTMLALDLKIPSSFAEYLDPNTSSLNPRNMGYNFFVYGTFPITFNKIIAKIFNTDTYNDFTLQGRLLSALAETLIIFLIFLNTKRLSKALTLPKYSAYLAAWFYATLVISIQLSHFFATDTFTNLFIFGSATLAISNYVDSVLQKNEKSIYILNKRELLRAILSGIWFGFAMASKVSAALVMPIILLVLILPALKNTTNKFNSMKNATYSIIWIAILTSVFVIGAYVSLKISDPTFFAQKSFVNPTVNPLLIQNIKELKSWEGEDTFFPPAIQWISTKPWQFPIKNFALFGMGIFHFSAMLLGFLAIGSYSVKHKRHRLLVLGLVFWMTGFFGYQGYQFVKAMRYFLVLMPFIALLTGLGLSYIFRILKNRISTLSVFSFAGIGISFLIWPAMFMSIYINTNTRVEASQWIYKNLESGPVVNELWDDPLPLRLEGTTKNFNGDMMPVFDIESPQKWRKINTMLKSADYYFLSSNRAWGSIPRVPQKYPQTTDYYIKLFDGKLGYTKVAEFTSRPSLKYLGIPFELNDDMADETFTVYDHPKVIIMVKDSFIPFVPQ